MKIQISLGFFMLVISLPMLLFAQQNRFDEATDLLEESKYREALEIYQEIENEGHKSGALWLNMGIIYSELDSPGMAKYYFMRSSSYPETKQIAEESVSYLDSRFSRRSAVLPQLPWESFFGSLKDSLGVKGLFMFGLFFLNIATGLLIASWFYKKFDNLFKYSAAVFLAVSVLLLLSGGYVDYLNNRFGTGVMVEDRIQIYENPNTESNSVSTAYEGYQFQVDYHRSNEMNGWSYVRMENGLYGWIDEKTIRVF